MTAYQTDEEQIETLKRFWAKFGTPLVIGLVVALLGVFGFRTWQAKEQKYAEQASALYQSLIVAVAKEPGSEEQRSIIKALRDDYAKSPYAILAALIAAKDHIDHQALAKAKTTLQWAVSKTNDQELNVIASLRLARVLAATGEVSEALQLTDKLDAPAFVGRVEEVRGDILAGAGQAAKAKKAYAKAIASYKFAEARSFVEMKMHNLPELGGAS